MLDFTTINTKNGENLQMAATTVKQPAAIQTYLNPILNASNNPPTPAPMICGVTPGISAKAAVSLEARAPMKAGREEAGRPRGRTAPAILVPRLAENLPVKIALSSMKVISWNIAVWNQNNDLQIARPILPPKDRTPINNPLVIEIISGGVLS